jgi:hypothetical protein
VEMKDNCTVVAIHTFLTYISNIRQVFGQ